MLGTDVGFHLHGREGDDALHLVQLPFRHNDDDDDDSIMTTDLMREECSTID